MAALENLLLRWQLSFLVPNFFIELTSDHSFELPPLVSWTQQPAYTRVFSLSLSAPIHINLNSVGY
jgi:hypothetical protein